MEPKRSKWIERSDFQCSMGEVMWKLNKILGAKPQPRCKRIRVITGRVITGLHCIWKRSNQWYCLMPFPFIVLFTSVDMVYPLWCITCLCSIWTLKKYCPAFHSYSGEQYRTIMALLLKKGEKFGDFLFVFYCTKPLLKRGLPKMKRTGIEGANYVRIIMLGRHKHSNRIASPGSVSLAQN